MQTLDLGNLGGTGITDLVREGRTLFTMDAGRELRAIRILDFEMAIGGRLRLPLDNGGGRLFVGNGIAYVTAEPGSRGGFATVVVSDPENLVLISASDVPGTVLFPRTDVAVNGSGLGLPLSRRMAEALGGSLDLAAAQPATFRLTLPRRSP